jgi:transposase
MKRHEISEEEWAVLDPLIPQSKAKTGRPASDRRTMLNGTMWILSTGAGWRDLPERFGPWQTVYGYFRTWRSSAVFDAILEGLHLRLDENGHIDWELWCIDGSSVRATRAAAGASKKVSSTIPRNRRTTDWAVREGDLAAKSTFSSTATARRSKSM